MSKYKYPYSILYNAKQHSIGNWNDLSTSTICGCYHCKKIFLSNSIYDWIGIDGRSMDHATALCPFCGMNSVIAESASYPLKTDFLESMYHYWFRNEKQEQMELQLYKNIRLVRVLVFRDNKSRRSMEFFGSVFCGDLDNYCTEPFVFSSEKCYYRADKSFHPWRKNL